MSLRKSSLDIESKSNCLVFAVRRWFSRGGFLILRKSNYGWWPHLVWTKDFITFEEFTPRVHNPNLALPPLLFRGFIKTTSREDQIANGFKGQIIRAVAFLKGLRTKLAVVDARKEGRPAETTIDEGRTFASELKRLERKVTENSRRMDIFNINKKLTKGLKTLAPKLIAQVKGKPRKLKGAAKQETTRASRTPEQDPQTEKAAGRALK
jgi:hypothetical protein